MSHHNPAERMHDKQEHACTPKVDLLRAAPEEEESPIASPIKDYSQILTKQDVDPSKGHPHSPACAGDSQRPCPFETTTKQHACFVEENSSKKHITVPVDQNEGRAIRSSLLHHYMQLWKTRLSLLVVFTAMGSYCCTRSGSGARRSSLIALCLGTFLQAGCANSLNEMMEVDRDRIMNRTMHRPLPTGSISMQHAAVQSVVVGATGTFILGRYCDWNTALLGCANIGIYAGVYTPLKVRHWTNTWVGTLNGAIPPLMGSCAATGGELFTVSGAFWFALMSLWQIPHFMAISYKCRREYQKAGYKMLPIEQPRKASNMSVVHSLALFPLCWSLPLLVPQVPWWFAVATTPLNWVYALKPSLQFRRDLHRSPSSFESEREADKVHYDNATHLFWCSLKHLPLLFSLSMVALNWDSVTEKTNGLLNEITSFFSSKRD